jgi:hypothetical protein
LKDSPATHEFFNNFFNLLNDFTTDLFVIFKEIIEHDPNFENGHLKRKLKYKMVLVMDQCKIMELMTDLASEAFVHEDSI